MPWRLVASGLALAFVLALALLKVPPVNHPGRTAWPGR
jgi:hypothetical protein